MTARTTTRLPNRLLEPLCQGQPAVLLTAGGDGFPASAYTWAVARSAVRIRFAVDHGSASLANLNRDGRTALHFMIEGGLAYLVKGRALPVKPVVEAALPIRMALWELEGMNAKDQSWPGVKVRPLAYDWAPARRRQMVALERAVYAEMRDWNP